MPTIKRHRFKLHSPRALPARRRHELDESDLSPETLARLSPDQRDWWLRFLEEDTAGKVKKGDPRAIYQADHQRKDAYQRQNRANRDLLNLATVTGALDSLDAPLDGQQGGLTLADVTPGEQLTEVELLQLAETLPDAPAGAVEGEPTFGGEAIYRWAEAHHVAPGPLRSHPTVVLRASLERFCLQREWRYPFGKDVSNNLLGRALKGLGLTGFEQGVRVPGQPRRWERVYGLARGVDPSLLDPRFWRPWLVRSAAPEPRQLFKAGRPTKQQSPPTKEHHHVNKKEKTVDPLALEPDAPPHPECLPVVRSLGIVEKGSRLVVVYMEIQGDKVITREVLSPCPEVPGVAANTFRLAVVRRLRVV